jgi:hypothetical protein
MIRTTNNERPVTNGSDATRTETMANLMNEKEPKGERTRYMARRRSFLTRTRSGQTLIVALIILGLLMILGLVYIGIVNRNILGTGTQQRRSIANDLSEAGIRYAHAQLLNSELGADWRGTPSGPISPDGVNTTDPDALYLRPASGYPFRAGSALPDLGGPDGLGPYFRTNFNGGRALVRVRYAPSDINIFSPSPTGALRNPGQVRNYLIIESIGRAGAVNATDPTTLSNRNPVQYTSFGTDANFRDALAKMQANERSFSSRAVNRAFASIGIIETARYITNKDKVSRPAEIGISSMLGAQYKGAMVSTGGAAPLALELGAFLPLYTIAQNPTITSQAYPGFGSIFVNGDLMVHGQVDANVNKALGDKWMIAGTIRPADGNARLTFHATEWNGGVWSVNNYTASGGTLDSRQGLSTFQSLLVDGVTGFDAQGYPRGIGIKPPPSMTQKDPDTGETRYVRMTRDSGVALTAGNSGMFGHGSGIYVSNRSDRQMPEDEIGRQGAGSATSLTYDWLNPNNGQTNSGWRGFLYTPPAAYVYLLSDGFTITRNGAAPTAERTWRFPNGADTNRSDIRYRLGLGTDGQVHIVNTYTNDPTTGWNVNGSLGALQYQQGPVFNGVLYFDGNVRVRGIIPTDVQITLVSNATIYIEGSITKGILGNGLQPGITRDERINRLSRSMLMLMARDYVTLNTTQFFGPTADQAVDPVNDVPNAPGFTPIRIRGGEVAKFQSEFVPDQNAQGANPFDPRTWPTYSSTYSVFGSPANKLTTSMLFAHTMDDGPAAATFMRMDINRGVFDPNVAYFFPQSPTNLANAALPNIDPTTTPIYGMGGEPYQRYTKFESILFPLVDPNTVNTTDKRLMRANNANGRYTLFAEGQNQFSISQTNFGGLTTNDYLIGRTAIVPHDIRIEATIFAEEGSFFVIPGQWFNPNPNDRRDVYDNTPGSNAEKQQRRLEDFGSYPGMPFYGEPPDVRITIVGAISENMPPTIDQQSQWMKKWGWIPTDLGASGVKIPAQHIPNGYDPNDNGWVPNINVIYDPVLATARANGFNNDPNANPFIRQDAYGRALPPLPRLPVGPALAFFGEVR